MNSRLQHWWLWGCFIAVLLASWAGGFSPVVTAFFIAIYLTGAVLIGPVEPDAPVVEETYDETVEETYDETVEETYDETVEETPDETVDDAEADRAEDDETGSAATVSV